MWSFLDKTPYSILIVFSIIMILLPFKPMPHFMEKLIMLKNGALKKPIDIFDLFYHSAPLILLIIKYKGMTFDKIPGDYLQWLSGTELDEDMAYTVKQHIGI